ncbi:MAG TPA: hypothetical protein VHE99_12080 [Gammaproteobacteria bacterium]|nr:hypothetical protein [Gammaproteobacteria bacterium]
MAQNISESDRKVSASAVLGGLIGLFVGLILHNNFVENPSEASILTMVALGATLGGKLGVAIATPTTQREPVAADLELPLLANLCDLLDWIKFQSYKCNQKNRP